jgi:serine/threonine-protein kinase
MEFCPRDGVKLAAQSTETEVQLAAGLSRRYRLVRRLGAGGMGTVFLARQIGVGNRPVALKVLNRKLLDDPQFLLRFQNEAGSTGLIRHPNVVSIYESAQADDGTPYIAMEFLEGESLRDILERRGALPVPEVAEILQQAARGLNAAHKLGIIHRDLKPDNIFLTYPEDDVGAGLVPAHPVGDADIRGHPRGAPLRPVVVKIVDFGIAKLRESAMHTQTGMVLGTPAYMSYEQAYGMRSDELDARSDIYSLGVLVYEMLSGRVPFHSDTPAGFLRKHVMDQPPPFQAVAPGVAVPPAVESAVMKALVKDRDQRYATALEFGREFGRAALAPSQAVASDFGPTLKVESLDRERADQERLTAEKAEAERRDKEKAGAEQAVREKAEQERLAREKAEAERREQEKAAAELVTREKAAQEEREIAEAIRKAQEKADQDRLAREKANVEHGAAFPLVAAAVRANPKDGLKYVWIPPGTFMMGCSPTDSEGYDREKPPHQVTINTGFWLGQTEVTVGAYKQFVGATGRQMPPSPSFNGGWVNDRMPIVNVTWNDANDYCKWAGGRLPTEAEWEYAARAGSTESRYASLDEVAWYFGNSRSQAHPVGQKRPNGFGLYDVLGNVEEWVNDWYDENYYQRSPSQDPTGPMSGTDRVLRGGSWDLSPRNVRLSLRVRGLPADRNDYIGFRCGGEMFAS